MRRNFETMDVGKIQERWYSAPFEQKFSGLLTCIGVVTMHLGSSESDGKKYLRISVTLIRKSLILRGYVATMDILST